MSEQRYLTLPQVQTELALSPEDVVELIRSGRLPAFRIVGRWRVDSHMLERLVDQLVAENEPILLDETNRVSPAEATAPITDGAPGPITVPHPRRGLSVHGETRPMGLTAHQHRIVKLVGEGMSNAEIAQALSVEVSTVKSHVSRVLQRLNLRDREQLIAMAWRSGVMDRGMSSNGVQHS